MKTGKNYENRILGFHVPDVRIILSRYFSIISADKHVLITDRNLHANSDNNR